MILIAGGTGTLGTQILRLLRSRGLDLRILSRDRDKARSIEPDQVDLITGDAREAAAVKRAVAGTDTVVSAITGFGVARDVIRGRWT